MNHRARNTPQPRAPSVTSKALQKTSGSVSGSSVTIPSRSTLPHRQAGWMSQGQTPKANVQKVASGAVYHTSSGSPGSRAWAPAMGAPSSPPVQLRSIRTESTESRRSDAHRISVDSRRHSGRGEHVNSGRSMMLRSASQSARRGSPGHQRFSTSVQEQREWTPGRCSRRALTAALGTPASVGLQSPMPRHAQPIGLEASGPDTPFVPMRSRSDGQRFWTPTLRSRPDSSHQEAVGDMRRRTMEHLPCKGIWAPSSEKDLNVSFTQVDTSVESPEAGTPPTPDLESGASVQIGDMSCEILHAIGEGTFGVVWGARSHGEGAIAIKEIHCQSQSALSDALFECQILHALQGAWGGLDTTTVGRVPAYLGSSTECLGPDEWRVRLAMTQIAGESLNRYLERRRHEVILSRRHHQRQFAEACTFARELVSQLAPAFARISTLAYHRDVNPRNILVETVQEGPRYGLIDFGLAVDATNWRVGAMQTASGEASVGAWQVLGVGGDCRYWPVSAWLMLEQGPKALCGRPQLCLEYKTHLDLHALGITALQVLVELAPRQSEFPSDDVVLEKLWALCDAWDTYWGEATYYWQRLFDAYRRSGDRHDLSVVKAEYRELAVHEQMGEHLRALRTSLREACEASKRSPDFVDGLLQLLQTLLAMISSGEDSTRSSWRRVELLIDRSPSRVDTGARYATRTPRLDGDSEPVAVFRPSASQAASTSSQCSPHIPELTPESATHPLVAAC